MRYTLYELLPHRPPFLLLDSVNDAGEDGRSITARFTPKEDTIFYDPVRKGLPAYVGLEIMAQTIGSLVSYNDLMAGRPRASAGKLLSMRHFSPAVQVLPVGEALDISVHADLVEEEIGSFFCSIHSAGKLLAEAELTVYREAQAQS